MIFCSGKLKRSLPRHLFFPSTVYNSRGWKLYVEAFFLPSLGTGIFLAVSVSRSVLPMSRGVQLLICYCRRVHEHEHNVVRRAEDSQWCCSLTPKSSTVPPRTKSSTSRTPQILPCPALSRAFPCACRMGAAVTSPATSLQATSLPPVIEGWAEIHIHRKMPPGSQNSGAGGLLLCMSYWQWLSSFIKADICYRYQLW